jgi:hypothetical protein
MSINTFKSKFQDISRANRFEVQGNILGGDISFLAKAASLPAATLGIMPVPFQGREIKLAGDRVYDDWDITVYQTNDADVRKRIDEWMVTALSHESNIGALAHTQYKEDLTVRQLDRAGSPIITYKLIGCMPTNLGPLDLAWDSNDTPAEFTVTIAYDYYEIS